MAARLGPQRTGDPAGLASTPERVGVARDKHRLNRTCTGSRQDTARWCTFSMRRSRFKDCRLLNLVYKGVPMRGGGLQPRTAPR